MHTLYTRLTHVLHRIAMQLAPVIIVENHVARTNICLEQTCGQNKHVAKINMWLDPTNMWLRKTCGCDKFHVSGIMWLGVSGWDRHVAGSEWLGVSGWE